MNAVMHDNKLKSLREDIAAAYLSDELSCVNELRQILSQDSTLQSRIETTARKLIEKVRQEHNVSSALDAFLSEYDLSSEEGVLLMCLAESLLRIPDSETANRLINEKLALADWERHLGNHQSLLVNASTWGLLLTGQFVRFTNAEEYFSGLFNRLLQKAGEPILRTALKEAMSILVHQFVIGRNIDEAINIGERPIYQNYLFSFDILGEAAICADDVARFFKEYAQAIERLAKENGQPGSLLQSGGVSIKLSALHPRMEILKRKRVMRELIPRVRFLVMQAMKGNVGITIDAEETSRLDLTLDIFDQLFHDPAINGWEGLGLAVQAYQKRAIKVINWLAELARQANTKIMIRLVKGAYWDNEIKFAQEAGLEDYPVFTQKVNTDISYLACAYTILQNSSCFPPQFATHNAQTIAAVYEMSREYNVEIEFQRLFGMGSALYDEVTCPQGYAMPCRIYAPVGSHTHLLPYLVRRLLENGANTSFVNRIADMNAPIESLIESPVAKAEKRKIGKNSDIPVPPDLFGDSRKNSQGLELVMDSHVRQLEAELNEYNSALWTASAIINGETLGSIEYSVFEPADCKKLVGYVVQPGIDAFKLAVQTAETGGAKRDDR